MPAPARLQNFTLRSPKELNGSVSNRVNEAIMKGMALNYKFRPQSVQEWLDLLGASPIPPTQPVISRPNTPPSWECVHIIPSISGEIVALSPKEDILASVQGSLIHLFSSITGQFLRTLTGHSSWVSSVTISSDDQILASGSGDKTIKLWSVTTGKEIRTLTGHSSSVQSVAISSDGQILASGSEDNTIKPWNVTTGKEIHSLTHFCKVTSISFTPDGNWLAAGDSGGNIKIWQPQLVVQ
ncbi:hypothetical protein GJB62_13030 [Nostoc sp. ATCC 53789]|nr:hypothetical protein GJB62_13030 [Nostoc sp. ATCC 53789]